MYHFRHAVAAFSFAYVEQLQQGDKQDDGNALADSQQEGLQKQEGVPARMIVKEQAEAFDDEDGVFFPGQNERLSALVVSLLPRQTIIKHLKQSIDEVFMPRTIYLVSALPRNNMGKLIKTELDQLIRTYQLGRK